jgi:hypothetical protein
MPSCSVYGCGNYNRKTSGTEIKYLGFPKSEVAKKLVIACKRKDPMNLKTGRSLQCIIIEDLGVKRLQATKTLKLIFLVQTIQK